MSSLYDVLDDYGLAGNEQATKLVESLLEVLCDMAGSEEPQTPTAPPKPKTACVGTYETTNGKTIVVTYDSRWLGDLDLSYPLRGHDIRDDDIADDNWTQSGCYLDHGADAEDLVIPEGHVHVHYAVVASSKHRVSYPKSFCSYEKLACAREDNCDNLPILRITYRDDQIISAQLVNDWETS